MHSAIRSAARQPCGWRSFAAEVRGASRRSRRFWSAAPAAARGWIGGSAHRLPSPRRRYRRRRRRDQNRRAGRGRWRGRQRGDISGGNGRGRRGRDRVESRRREAGRYIVGQDPPDLTGGDRRCRAPVGRDGRKKAKPPRRELATRPVEIRIAARPRDVASLDPAGHADEHAQPDQALRPRADRRGGIVLGHDRPEAVSRRLRNSGTEVLLELPLERRRRDRRGWRAGYVERRTLLRLPDRCP